MHTRYCPSPAPVLLAALLWAASFTLMAQDTGSISSPSALLGSSSSSGSSRSGSSSSRSSSSRSSSSGSNSNGSRTENDTRRDNQTRDNTRNKNSNLKGNNASKNTTGKNAKPTTVKGSTPRNSRSSGKGPGPGTTVEFKMKPNPLSNVLYTEGIADVPTLNIATSEGEQFGTRTVLRNGRKSAFQTLEFSIKYDPTVIQPVGIDYDVLADLLDGQASAIVDSRHGVVSFRAKLLQPRSDDNFEIAKIEWQAVGPSSNSPIAFLNTATNPTRILGPVPVVPGTQDGAEPVNAPPQDILAPPQTAEDTDIEPSPRSGLLDASVAVSPNAKTSAAIRESEGTLASMALVNSISEGTAQGGVQLALRPRTGGVRVGDTFLVDVVYANPRRAEINEVRLNIRFDPRVLQVVDYDDGNWITRGVNIFDGDYHDDLPFDFHMKNNAYNVTGEIRYEMGFNSRVQVPAAGTIATIKFRAIGPASQTPVQFALDESSTDQQTQVSFLGFNLIGTPGHRALAVQGTTISVM